MLLLALFLLLLLLSLLLLFVLLLADPVAPADGILCMPGTIAAAAVGLAITAAGWHPCFYFSCSCHFVLLLLLSPFAATPCPILACLPVCIRDFGAIHSSVLKTFCTCGL